MNNKIKELALSYGADVCGIASIERFENAPDGFSPKDIWKDCKSVITLGIALPKGLLEVEPRLVYGHFNNITLCDVDETLLKCSKRLEREFGCIAIPVPCDSPQEYWDEATLTAKGLLSMKHTAVLCGLGTIGKSSLLLNPQFGSLLTIGAILTDLPLESDPLCPNVCIEGCTLCIDSCPVHAINNRTVNQKYCRENSYGKTKRGFETVDCNLCRSVCPRRFGIK